jgi:hypothetical protein
MTDSHRRGKKRPTLVEGFNNVPHILEEARQAVDDVTRARTPGGTKPAPAAPKARKAAGAGPKRPQATPRKTSAPAGGPPKKPARPPAARPQPKAPVAKPAAAAGPAGGQLSLAHCGIRVKHAIPGRIRLRLYKMLHNESLAAKLPPLLAAVPGVAAVEASANTGSLLITYNPGKLAAVQGRRDLTGVMHQFFPGLDTASLIKLMLGG